MVKQLKQVNFKTTCVLDRTLLHSCRNEGKPARVVDSRQCFIGKTSGCLIIVPELT